MYYNIDDFFYGVQKIFMWIQNNNQTYTSIHGVPQGGVPLAIELSNRLHIPIIAADGIEEHTLIVDDIVDSGRTRVRYIKNDFVCLHWKTKQNPDFPTPNYAADIISPDDVRWDEWIVYWWEGKENKSIDDSVIRMLEYIGEDPTREGLKDTPDRVIKSWKHLFSGYKQLEEDIPTTFDSKGHSQIVLLKNIELYSMCEHHIMPFIGKAHVAYIPNQKIMGISKLARIVEMYARRLQIQERIGEQVTEFLMKHLNAEGAACMIEAQHLCMQMRGVEKQNSVMVTSSLKGVFMDKPAARKELMDLIK